VQWDGSPPNIGPLQLTVPGKGRMVFLRGGYHLHCEKPTRPINVGDTVPVTVDFRHLPSVTATFEVKPLSQPSVAR
ncbi:MAG: copper chaperone PCu(A)C, partial [Gluconacetobacter diazotrophicus]|nr:copper chaperone PCu(A)C [Gluconacetobacter diazotrophicus]